MPLPRGPRFASMANARPQSGAKSVPTIGVGWRAVVRSGGSPNVTLTDEAGIATLANVADGIEVEILAWRPTRGGEARYRVVTTSGGVEGWLGAAKLQRREIPFVPKPVAAAPSPPVAALAATARKTTTPARRREPVTNGRASRVRGSGAR